MATVKVLTAASNSETFSSTLANIFSCCFASNNNNNASDTTTNDVARQTEIKKQEAEKIQIVKEEEGGGVGGGGGGKSVSEYSEDVEARGRGSGGVKVEDERDYCFAVRDLSDRDSIPGDDFRDSAIDSASLSSQLNQREELTDAEAIRACELRMPEEYASVDIKFNKDDKMGDHFELNQESSVEDAGLNALNQTETVLEESDKAEIAVTGETNDILEAVDPPQSTDGQSVTQCGIIRMTFANDSNKHRLSVTVNEAKDVPGSGRVNLSHSEVHLLLNLASKKIRHKTKAKVGENPQFEETFHFKLSSGELTERGFRVRLYRSETFKKEQLIGETYVNVPSILSSSKNNPHTTWITLEPRFNLMTNAVADEQNEVGTNNTSSQSSSASELMVGLAYNSNTGRLAVEVFQGCRFKSLNSQKPPDTCVKLKLMSVKGEEIARSKTITQRKQPNPSFKEIFMFHVPKIQLPDVSLMISVCEHRSLKHSQILGWFTLGRTYSSEGTKRHWSQMIEKNGEQISQWHSLLNP